MSEFADLLPAIAASLDHDILGAWYPRAVDTENGGFHQSFTADWQATPDDKRGVVYQSRLTWVAAQAALYAAPGSDAQNEWKRIARHGLACLQSTFWDAESSGFFFETTLDGKPETPRKGEKSTYGLAFGIYATCAVFTATGDETALRLAQQAFVHAEACLHDAVNGGYVEALTRDNTPIHAAHDGVSNDPIGTRYGAKSMNTHIHLLEAFTALFAVYPVPCVKTRLAELSALVRDRIASDAGFLHLYVTLDFTPLPGHDSFGHDVETAFLLHEAAHVLGDTNPRTAIVARRLVDHALAFGYDTKRGGFYYEGVPGGAPTHTAKNWWTQAEGLNALLLLHRLHGHETPRYGAAFRQTWDFIARHQIDYTNGGWRSEVAADGTPNPRAPMSDSWKDPYHQARALLTVKAALQGVGLTPQGLPAAPG